MNGRSLVANWSCSAFETVTTTIGREPGVPSPAPSRSALRSAALVIAGMR
ncbi:unannotated protein [freshwater metagenome]|uniref:Unannotated protein n=1 Tax=freshwater metagenome TaxID=449393 RepID=A0A6J7DY00_9ZZZZ